MGYLYASLLGSVAVGVAVLLLLLVVIASSIGIIPVCASSRCVRYCPLRCPAIAGFPRCGLAPSRLVCVDWTYYMRLLGLLRDTINAGLRPTPLATHRSIRVVISSVAALVVGFLPGPLRLHSFAKSRVITSWRCVL